MLEDNFLIPFTEYDHQFCESKLWGKNNPEIFNCLSCIFMILVSYYGLQYSHLSSSGFFVLINLAINGMLSFLYHFTGSIGWGILDRLSMVLIAYFSLIMMGKLVLIILFRHHNYENYKLIKNTKIYINIFISIYIITLLTTCSLHSENLFNILFGLFLAFITIFTFIANIIFKNEDFVNLNKFKNLTYHSKLGCFLFIFGSLFWIAIEELCNTNFIYKYLMGHAIWHLCMAFGAYYLVLSSNFIILVNKQYMRLPMKIHKIAYDYDTHNFLPLIKIIK